MRQGVLNKKIPTLLALFLLVGGIGLSIFFLNNTTSLTGEASPQDQPKNIRVSNITDTSFDVTYTTDESVVGTISYGTDPKNLSSIATDTQSSITHTITVTDLTPATTYYFTITSGTTEYRDNDNPFTVKTGITLPPPTDKQTISGVILGKDGTNAGGVLVYLTTNGAETLSTVTSSLGEFTIDASLLRTADLTSYVSLTENQILNLIGQTNTEQTAAVFLLKEGNPLPQLSLSQTYNFTTTVQNQTQQSTSASFPVLSTDEKQEVEIDSPTSDETFTDLQPEFDGTALPRADVEIIIQSSQEIRATIQADQNGNWSYRPDEPLEPGEHTLTVRSRDENGILRILTRQFTVFAEGSQFTQPSVSPSQQSPTPTRAAPTLTPTAAALPSPTATATGGIETISPTPTATQTPTPTVQSPTLTPRPTVTPTGSNSSSILAIMSLGIFLTGTMLFVLTKIKSL